MIDTLVLEYLFPLRFIYDDCYYAIDAISRRQDDKHMRLHRRQSREFKIPAYTTTAFKRFGWLEIMFYKYQRGCAVRIIFKPIYLLYKFSQLRLSKYNDFDEVEKRFNATVDAINREAGHEILPYLNEWRVTRLDYAVDLNTPFVNTYIDLFKIGFIPRGFFAPKNYATSYYLISDNSTINFYNKIEQVKAKHNYTNEYIENEIGFMPDGILRLEIQCKSGCLAYLRRKYKIGNLTLKPLWNPVIAADVIKQKISSIIGQEDFFTFEHCMRVLQSKFKRNGFRSCADIVCAMKISVDVCTMEIIKKAYEEYKQRATFNVLLSRIHTLDINAIPLDCAIGTDNLEYLKNPYNIIDELIAKENASQELSLVEKHFA